MNDAINAVEAETMTDDQIRQWIEACNHEPARQVLREYIKMRASTREAIARMRRSLDQYENCSPEAISKGSEAQMRYFVADAKHDIAVLALPCADEAAIRADQREIDAKIADGFVERVDREARPLRHKIMLEKHSWTIASAIRNGGKQP